MSVLNTSFRASGEVAGDGHFGSIYWDGFDAEHRPYCDDLSKYADRGARADTIVIDRVSRSYFPAGILIGTGREVPNSTRPARRYDVRIRLAADMTAPARTWCSSRTSDLTTNNGNWKRDS